MLPYLSPPFTSIAALLRWRYLSMIRVRLSSFADGESIILRFFRSYLLGRMVFGCLLLSLSATVSGAESPILARTEKPLLALDQPWEQGGRMTTLVGVVPDPFADRLRLYYKISFPGRATDNILCVAYSSDGYNWIKPDLGEGTNIVMRASGNSMEWGAFHPQSIIYDENESNSVWRWKMLFWGRWNAEFSPGFHIATSKDGLSWNPLHRPVITNANDAGSFVSANPRAPAGPRESPVLLYQQTWSYNPNLPTERDNLDHMQRVISIWTCDPFPGRWIGPTQILVPDENDAADLQYYWFVPFSVGDGYYGLMNVHHTADQRMDVQLMSSVDGWTWERELDRAPLIPLGEKGRFDCGMVMVTAPPVLWKGKLMLFYNGRATVHDHQRFYPKDPLPSPAKGIGVVELSPAIYR